MDHLSGLILSLFLLNGLTEKAENMEVILLTHSTLPLEGRKIWQWNQSTQWMCTS